MVFAHIAVKALNRHVVGATAHEHVDGTAGNVHVDGYSCRSGGNRCAGFALLVLLVDPDQRAGRDLIGGGTVLRRAIFPMSGLLDPVEWSSIRQARAVVVVWPSDVETDAETRRPRRLRHRLDLDDLFNTDTLPVPDTTQLAPFPMTRP